ncbi:MAG: hypothetical protein AAF806_03870 [Bacteroidota bacterium]
MLSTITVLGLIFTNVSVKNKSQRTFLEELFSLLPAIRGRFNFCNLARYSNFNEVSFRRNFSKAFNGIAFNYAMIQLNISGSSSVLIAAVDASFISKSCKRTFGLGKFWSGCFSTNSNAELNQFFDINQPDIQKIINLGQVVYKKSA